MPQARADGCRKMSKPELKRQNTTSRRAKLDESGEEVVVAGAASLWFPPPAAEQLDGLTWWTVRARAAAKRDGKEPHAEPLVQ